MAEIHDIFLFDLKGSMIYPEISRKEAMKSVEETIKRYFLSAGMEYHSEFKGDGYFICIPPQKRNIFLFFDLIETLSELNIPIRFALHRGEIVFKKGLNDVPIADGLVKAEVSRFIEGIEEANLIFVSYSFYKEYIGGKFDPGKPEFHLDDVRTIITFKSIRIITKHTDVNSELQTYSVFNVGYIHNGRYFGIQYEDEKKIQPQTIRSNDFFDYIDSAYWQHLTDAGKTETDLIDFYLRSDSNANLLPYVINYQDKDGDPFYIPADNYLEVVHESEEQQESEFRNIEELLSFIQPGRNLLLKILSGKGEGKSTFLLQIAKEHFSQFNILYCTSTKDTEELAKYLPDFENDNKTIILIDDIRVHESNLDNYCKILKRTYNKQGFALIIAERETRYIRKAESEAFFDNVFTVRFKISPDNKIKFFNKLCGILSDREAVSFENYEELKTNFLNANSLTLVERVRVLYKALRLAKKLKIKDDWEDWEEFIKKNPFYSNLLHLYTIVATFDKFGIGVPIEFESTTYLPRSNAGIIYSVLHISKGLSLPIKLESDHLKLRHESMADWYFEEEAHRKIASYFFEDFLSNIGNKRAAYLFRNLYSHPEFKNCDFLASKLPIEKAESILRKYLPLIDVNDKIEEGKTTMELCKAISIRSYGTDLYKEKKIEIIKILEDFLRSCEEDKHVRTYLAGFYMEFERYAEAEELLDTVLSREPNNEYALVRLIGIYNKLNSPDKKVSDIYLKLYESNVFDLGTLLAAAKRNLKESRYTQAIELINFYRSKKPDKESTILLARIYVLQQDFNSAEKILLSLEDEPDIKLDLSFLYQEEGPLFDLSRSLAYLRSSALAGLPVAQIRLIDLMIRMGKTKEEIIPEIERAISNDQLIIKEKLYKIWSQLYCEEWDYENAIKIIREGLSVYPDSILLKNEIIELYLLTKNPDLAEEFLKSIENKEHIAYKLLSAKIYFSKGTIPEMIQVLLPEYRLDSKNLSILALLIRAYMSRNELTNAKRYILEFLKLKANDNEMIVALGKVIFSPTLITHDDLVALKEIRNANKANYYLNLYIAIACRKKGLKEESINEFKKLQSEFNYKMNEGNYQLAALHLSIEDYDQARDYFEKIPPTPDQDYIKLGWRIFMALKDDKKILEFFQQGINLNPNNISPYFDLADYYIGQATFGSARDILYGAQKKFPSHIEVRNKTAQLYSAWAEYNLEKEFVTDQNEFALLESMYHLIQGLNVFPNNGSFIKRLRKGISLYIDFLEKCIPEGKSYMDRGRDRLLIEILSFLSKSGLDQESLKTKLFKLRLIYLLNNKQAFEDYLTSEFVEKKSYPQHFKIVSEFFYKAGQYYFDRRVPEDNITIEKAEYFYKQSVRFNAKNFRSLIRLTRLYLFRKNKPAFDNYFNRLMVAYPTSGVVKRFKNRIKSIDIK